MSLPKGFGPPGLSWVALSLECLVALCPTKPENLYGQANKTNTRWRATPHQMSTHVREGQLPYPALASKQFTDCKFTTSMQYSLVPSRILTPSTDRLQYQHKKSYVWPTWLRFHALCRNLCRATQEPISSQKYLISYIRS